MYRIFLVEDQADLAEVLTVYLQNEGWQVRSFLDGESARAAISERPDLWILDIMLPGVDGYQLIREIKADQPRLPVIFISARDADIDRIVGLELGSDDYMAKPFLPRELVIRTRKLLERVYDSETYPGVHQCRPYTLDERSRQVKDESGQPIELTSKEFELLLYFTLRAGQSLEREQVLSAVWGSDYFGSDRVVDDLVRRLRRKLPLLRLETVYGFGYRMVKA
ncbi:response regulator transcription factor [Paenibacillus allorhizosphaerae]|uniref:Transcriptional regulatory protein CssR n=1 Tax=Paenibacillus allorhizosphaerae TaxID=2849866 RepID=A0ABM8VRU4_9BACL|nr:response regulator transcription factor [Paenibacillus allorhizosphaerae]CAG7655772.1 Transcriptional regulatory protein CssR [Paenibacillus allorhizosphaerae]